MKLSIAIAFVGLVCAVSAADKRQIGICVEECSLTLSSSHILRSLGVGQCPDGFVCKSNGCGHTCQKDSSFTTDTMKCSGVLCAMYCDKGFQVDEHGCPICKCQ